MEIAILCNDVAKSGFFCEHGISLLIDEETIFDTGTTDVAVKNADELGIKLNRVKRIFISHGHYDHLGGLPYILKRTGKVDLYIQKKALIPKYSGNRFTGAPYEWKKIEEMACVHLLEGNAQIDGFELINDVPTVEENIDKNFLVDGVHDLFEDEMNLFRDGILITGCAHRGIENILGKALEAHDVKTVIGGFHLKDSDFSRIKNVLDAFKRSGVEVVPLHCTGEKAIGFFKNQLEDKCIIANAGDLLTL